MQWTKSRGDGRRGCGQTEMGLGKIEMELGRSRMELGRTLESIYSVKGRGSHGERQVGFSWCEASAVFKV